jgi:NAD-dependent SIR2 family protein deacetylase
MKATTAVGFKRAIEEWNQFPHLNIEEFYVLADLKERLTKTRSQQAADARHLITRTIGARLEQANTAYHDRFVRRVWANAGRDGQNFSIITTNWDILVDNAVRRFKDDPSAEGPPGLSYGPLDFQGPKRSPGARAAQASFRVLKLHGSLNWWFCPEDGYVDTSQTEKGHLPFYERGEGPRCPSTGAPDHSSGPMEPFLVPPSAQKFDSSGPEEAMRTLWEAARLELHHAQRISFVGYSFPDLDVQFKMLVNQALKQNTGLKTIEVVTSKKLGNERVSFEDRIKAVLGGLPQYPLVTVNDSGFEGWLARI